MASAKCNVCQVDPVGVIDGACAACRNDPHLTEPKRTITGWLATCSCGWTAEHGVKSREHAVVHGLLHRSIAHLYTR